MLIPRIAMTFAVRLVACLPRLTGASLGANNDFLALATDLNSVTIPYYGWVGGTGTACASATSSDVSMPISGTRKTTGW
jgi:hypothetical protein